MSLKAVEMWTIACDECGREAFESYEIVAWSDPTGALESFNDGNDWSEFEGKHRCRDHNPFCERCGEDAGELSGERDYLCPMCFEKVALSG